MMSHNSMTTENGTEWVCPTCAKEIPLDMEFCPNCGQYRGELVTPVLESSLDEYQTVKSESRPGTELDMDPERTPDVESIQEATMVVSPCQSEPLDAIDISSENISSEQVRSLSDNSDSDIVSPKSINTFLETTQSSASEPVLSDNGTYISPDAINLIPQPSNVEPILVSANSAPLIPPDDFSKVNGYEWICPICSTRVALEEGYCRNCGQYRGEKTALEPNAIPDEESHILLVEPKIPPIINQIPYPPQPEFILVQSLGSEDHQTSTHSQTNSEQLPIDGDDTKRGGGNKSSLESQTPNPPHPGLINPTLSTDPINSTGSLTSAKSASKKNSNSASFFIFTLVSMLLVACLLFGSFLVIKIISFTSPNQTVVASVTLITEVEKIDLTITPQRSPTAQSSITPTPRPTCTHTPTVTITPLPTVAISTDPAPGVGIPPACDHVGRTWDSPLDGMTLACVPAGRFTYEDKELKQSTPTLKAFWVDVYEVTNAQYAACVTAQVCSPPGHTGTLNDEDGDYFGNPNYAAYPVIYVSYYDASNYCAWAGRRLLTEMEWQKAARGPSSKGDYSWGSAKPNNSLANMGTGGSYVVAVGSYPHGASPYGALDMIGNVREWTSTSGPDKNTYFVKGGSFDSEGSELEISFLGTFYDANDQSPRIGFRCAWSLP